MEARASDDHARLFLGEVAEYLCFGVINLFRGDFTVFGDGVAHLAAQAELLVILAEIAPPVGLLSSDALNLLNGKVKLFRQFVEDILVIHIDAEQIAQFASYLSTARSELAVYCDHKITFFHNLKIKKVFTGQRYNFLLKDKRKKEIRYHMNQYN